MGAPYISVVVTAHDRRQYLEGGLSSIFCQTLDPEQFEIVLITNFQIEQDKLRKRNLKWIRTEAKEVQHKIAEALISCRGEVVCFLEDDDLWESNRLQIVYDLFRKWESLSFYHNSFSIIDEAGNPTDRPMMKAMQRRIRHSHRITTNRQKVTFGEIRKLIKAGISFNLSCMAIRREKLSPYLNYLGEFKSRSSNADTFTLYAALLSGGDIMADDRELTRYRVHAMNATHSFITAGVTPEDLGYSTLLKMVGTGEENIKFRKSIECMISDMMFERYSKENVKNRTLMAREIINHLRYFSFYDMSYDMSLIIFGLLYLISPSLGEIIHSLPGQLI